MASSPHSDPRCGNTIHSNYVTDHRCQRERGHLGDCWFGVGFVEQLEAAYRACERIAELTDGPAYPPALGHAIRLAQAVVSSPAKSPGA